MTVGLGGSAWPEVDVGLLVVPVGSVEQHGPHLPLDTDTRIAVAVAQDLVDRGRGPTGRILAPAIPYGASGEHEMFPGTVSLGAVALRTVLVEYGRSACRWADRVLFVNGHGGNASALTAAVRLLRYEARDVAWWTPIIPGGDAHAGRTETSMMLHLAPDAVRLSEAEPGNVEPTSALWERMRAGGVGSVSRSGVLGDPTAAGVDEGRRIVTGLCEELRLAAARWRPDENGRIAAEQSS